jgi:hypothetical protein
LCWLRRWGTIAAARVKLRNERGSGGAPLQRRGAVRE